MSCENLQKPYKQRFKGVENFLRRVAFNLGNTASQTEVKIISCIPIDVTDLQQTIINLEKQLHESKQLGAAVSRSNGFSVKPKISEKDGVSVKDRVSEKSGTEGKSVTKNTKAAAVVNTALFGTSFANQSSALLYYNDKHLQNMDAIHVATHCDCSSRRKKSNISLVFPTLSAPKNEQACSFSSRENFNTNEDDRSFFAPERYINIFKKRKRRKTSKGKDKIKTQLVYYAQHNQNNPFFTNDKQVYQTLNKNTQAKHTISQIYLNNIMQRQYNPNFVEEFSDTSQFSRPICRDIDQNYCNRSCLYESDVCSCCHGQFQNIDNYMTKHFEPVNRLVVRDSNNTNEMYYDSNLYDMIPVKENANILMKESLLTKNERAKNLEIRCWPEHLRSKYRYTPVIVNYQKNGCNIKRQNKKPLQKILKNGDKSAQYQRQQVNKQDQHIDNETSKNSCIDCGKIYIKQISPVKIQQQKYEPIKTIMLKNESVETDSLNAKLPLQNQSTQLELIPYENKTESTLNQIKSILQSVLTEVKTSTKVNNTEMIQKKDAIVQKGTSQNNMQGDSTFLHSFTYNNSYNTSPNLPSCSQAPTGQYCFTGVPYNSSGKYLQNFPVFIHPATGRHMCTCYYRKNSYKSSNKQATTASTNTDKDVKKACSKETEKLIKEIYKSMALNMDLPTKDNSASEYDDLKSAENEIGNEFNTKGKKEDERSTGTEVLNKRDIEVEALMSSNASDNCKIIYTATSTQSENNEKDNSTPHYKTSNESKANRGRILREFTHYSTDTIIEDEEAKESNNESENDEIVISDNYNLQPKKKKEGIFHKMLKSLKLKKRKEVEMQSESEERFNAGDSDNETISSGRSIKLPTQMTLKDCYEHNDHSKFKASNLTRTNRNEMHERARRSPYLEQEYRRQWNERLMFDKKQEKKYSSERPFSKLSSSYPQPTYWTNYEARSAIVKQDLPNKLKLLNPTLEKENRLGVVHFEQNNNTKDKLRWLKKHKLGINCGEQWKKFILEN